MQHIHNIICNITLTGFTLHNNTLTSVWSESDNTKFEI